MPKDCISNDSVLPFVLAPDAKGGAIKGRLVRIDDAVSSILARHDYPLAIAELSAEAMALSVVLASMMDFEGVFTLQASGTGDLKVLFADVTSEGALRSYAQYSEDFDMTLPLGDPARLLDLMGGGHLAFSVDQVDQGRYQGIVPLEDNDLNAAAIRYFYNSEQIDSALLLVAKPNDDGSWRSSALLLQRIPDDGGVDGVKNGKVANGKATKDEDLWLTACTLMATCSRSELVDNDISGETLLYRLFNEMQVSVLPRRYIKDECRCSPERVDRMLDGLPYEDLVELADDGIVLVSCEFCKKEHQKILPSPESRGKQHKNGE